MPIGNNKLDENCDISAPAETGSQAECLLNSDDLIKRTIEQPECLSDDDIRFLLKSSILDTIFDDVVEAKEKMVGKQVFVRSSIEISNNCRCSCNYCGMSSRNRSIHRFRLSKDDIADQIELAKSLGADTIHLTSAEDPNFPLIDICQIVDFVRKKSLDLVLVLGEKRPEEYQVLYNAGARKYTMKFETSDPAIFRNIKNNSQLSDRLKCLEVLRTIGFQIGTGIIVGLPGQTIDTLVSDLRLLQDLKPEMASASVFAPNKDSEYADLQKGDADLALHFNLLMRLLLRNPVPKIPSSSSFSQAQQIKILQAAANVISINLTPDEVALYYSMYGGEDRAIRGIEEIIKTIESAGLTSNLNTKYGRKT